MRSFPILMAVALALGLVVAACASPPPPVAESAMPPQACQCAHEPDECLSAADLVFEGKAGSSAVTTNAAGVITTTEFQVTQVWRGSADKTVAIQVDAADCRIGFQSGVSYRVFAARGKDGSLSTNGCSPTKPLASSKWICDSDEWLKPKQRR